MSNRWQQRRRIEEMPSSLAPWYDLFARLKRLLVNRTYPLSGDKAITPFFLVGSGRCGTTLLRRILQANTDVHIPPETYVLGQIIELYKRNRQMDWKSVVYLVLARFEFHPEFGPFGVSLRELAQTLCLLPEAERSLSAVIDGFYRYHASKSGREIRIWGDKTPAYVYSLEAIRQLFPKARFIHLIRDGVDVVHSYMQRRLIPDLEVAAERWRTSIGAFATFAAEHPGNCLEIRYEELVRHPADTVRLVCDFIGIEFDTGMLDALGHVATMGDVPSYRHYQKAAEPIATKYVGLGRRELDAMQLAQLNHLIAAELKTLDYPPVVTPG